MSDLRRLSNDAVLDMSTGMYTNPLCYTPEADADAVRAWIRSIPPLVAPVQVEAVDLDSSIRELQRNALPLNCTRCHGVGAEPPGCPESGPCELCGGWTAHKRLVAAEADTLRAKLAEVERRLALSDAALAEQIANRTKAETERDAAVRRAEAYAPEHDAAHLDRWLTVARDEADTLRAKLAEVERERDAAKASAAIEVECALGSIASAAGCGMYPDAETIVKLIGEMKAERDEAKAARKACPVDVSTLRLLRASGLFGNEINTLAGWALEEEARR